MIRQGILAGLAMLFVAFAAPGDLAAAPERVTLKVEGLTQTGCSSAGAVRGTIERTEGVARAEVSLERGEAVVELDPAKVDVNQLMATVERYCLVKVTRPAAP